MKKVLRYVIFLVLPACLTTCDEDFITREYPSVITGKVAEDEGSGIVFSGKLISRNASNIEDVGFIWQSNDDPMENPGYKISLSERIKEGFFSVKVGSGLRNNIRYMVRAYAVAAGFTVYGDTVRFMPGNEYSLPLFRIDKETGHAGDTVMISGGLVNQDLTRNGVTFGSLPAEILSVSDSSLSCIVPVGLTEENSTITVTIEDLASILNQKFTLVRPTISGFSPVVAEILDTVTITGTGFNRIPELNEVRFGIIKARVLFNTSSRLDVEVPFTGDSLCNITVSVSGQSAASQEKIRIRLPEVEYFAPAAAGYLDTVTIFFKNINPANVTTVQFGGVNAEIVYRSQSRIKARVPAGLNMEFSDLKVVMPTFQLAFGYKFNLYQPEIVSISKSSVFNQEVMTINGDYFNPVAELNKVYLKQTENGRVYDIQIVSAWPDSVKVRITDRLAPGWSVASGTYVIGVQTCEAIVWSDVEVLIADYWRRLPDFPGGARYKGAAFSINGKGYAGLGTRIGNDLQKDLWEFDPATELWKRVADFPGVGRIWPVVFSNTESGMVGGGQDLDDPSQNPLNDFYKYSPASNSWIRIKDVPEVAKSYVGPSSSPLDNTHVTNTAPGKLFEYDSHSNSWLLTYAGPGISNSSMQAFSINGKTYFVGGLNNAQTNGTNNQVWEYDPASNTMTRKNDFPGKSRALGISFAIGGYGYIGCGVNTVYNAGIVEYLTDFYRYDPVNDTWTSLGNFPGGKKRASISFVAGNKAIILTGFDSNNLTSDVWEFYDPVNK